MDYSKLGTTDISISRVCLGTMTFGQQNSESEGHQQMDYAVGRGVNFFDTAELYAVPTTQATYGKTEEIIGTWFQKKKGRSNIVLATKVAGIGVPWIRNGEPMTGQSVRVALEGSLRRLQTDYIDLYQVHWPNRASPNFGLNNAGEIDFSKEQSAEVEDNIMDILSAMDDLVKSGKVRNIGISDESSWGVMKYLGLSERHGKVRVQSIQNEYNLLRRVDDPHLAEVCVRENVSYLPWSPLASGMISRKYRNGARPAGSRWVVAKELKNHFESFRDTPQAHAAIEVYAKIANDHGLNLTQMALKFVDSQTFVTSTIIGATTMDHLRSNIDAFDIHLPDSVKIEINEAHKSIPIPY